MNRKVIQGILFLHLMMLTACNANDEKIVIMEDINNPSREEIRAKTQAEPNAKTTLSKEVGLGDTRKQFDKALGDNQGDQEIARYQGEFMLVTFEAHRAVNVQLQFGLKPGEPMSEGEISSYIQDRIPTDAMEINRSRSRQNASQEIIEYRSETLRKSMGKHSFRGDEPGRFVVIINKNGQGEVSATLSLGSGHNG